MHVVATHPHHVDGVDQTDQRERHQRHEAAAVADPPCPHHERYAHPQGQARQGHDEPVRLHEVAHVRTSPPATGHAHPTSPARCWARGCRRSPCGTPGRPPGAASARTSRRTRSRARSSAHWASSTPPSTNGSARARSGRTSGASADGDRGRPAEPFARCRPPAQQPTGQADPPEGQPALEPRRRELPERRDRGHDHGSGGHQHARRAPRPEQARRAERRQGQAATGPDQAEHDRHPLHPQRQDADRRRRRSTPTGCWWPARPARRR